MVEGEEEGGGWVGMGQSCMNDSWTCWGGRGGAVVNRHIPQSTVYGNSAITIASAKGELSICLCGRFVIENKSGQSVLGLNLGENESGYHGCLEDDEDTVLQGGAAVVEMRESQAGEEGDDK